MMGGAEIMESANAAPASRSSIVFMISSALFFLRASSFETLASQAPQDEALSLLVVGSAAMPRVSNHEAKIEQHPAGEKAGIGITRPTPSPRRRWDARPEAAARRE